MSILVLESDPAQVETIRHIVCNVLGTELTIVDSFDDAFKALEVSTPDLVLLPALVSPAEEAKMMTFLRGHPRGAHIETLFTPVINRDKKDTSTGASTRGWLRWLSPRRASEAASIDDTTTLFTERLTWSLRNARERRRMCDEPSPAVDNVDTRNVPNEAVAPVSGNEEIALEVVAEAIPDGAERPVASSPVSREDRRVHPRFHADELKALRGSRVAGGPRVNVRDVSTGGALLESDTPLEHDFGALELVTSVLHAHYVPFSVIRRQVETDGNLTRHVEACVFLEPLDVSVLRGPEASTCAEADGISDLRAALDPFLTGPASAERRRHVRVDGPFDGCRRGVMDTPVLILNLSQGGCFVDSRLEADPGRSLVLGLCTADGEWIDVTAEVIHNQPGIGFAVRFGEISETTRDILTRIIAERAAALNARGRTAARSRAS
jgi:hypothetical protein